MQFIGFITIFTLTALAGVLVKTTAADPDFILFVSSYSTWLGSHTITLGWIAVAVILISGITIPPYLMKKEMQDGNDRLSAIGTVTASISWVYVFLVDIPAIGYLLGVGWFAASKTIGQ